MLTITSTDVTNYNDSIDNGLKPLTKDLGELNALFKKSKNWDYHHSLVAGHESVKDSSKQLRDFLRNYNLVINQQNGIYPKKG